MNAPAPTAGITADPAPEKKKKKVEQPEEQQRKDPPIVEMSAADVPKRLDSGIKVATKEELQLSLGISPEQVRNLFFNNNTA